MIHIVVYIRTVYGVLERKNVELDTSHKIWLEKASKTLKAHKPEIKMFVSLIFFSLMFSRSVSTVNKMLQFKKCGSRMKLPLQELQHQYFSMRNFAHSIQLFNFDLLNYLPKFSEHYQKSIFSHEEFRSFNTTIWFWSFKKSVKVFRTIPKIQFCFKNKGETGTKLRPILLRYPETQFLHQNIRTNIKRLLHLVNNNK